MVTTRRGAGPQDGPEAQHDQASSQAASLDSISSRFLKGTAISVWQNSADEGSSNWTRFAYSRWPFKGLGVSTHKGKYKVGKSCDFWNRFQEDMQLAKNVGSNTFRFSFEWARIEPTRGTYDKEAIRRFHEMLDSMEEHGLVPNATLHHFTHPTWFEDLGGFRREENIPIFVEWAVMMFKEFGGRIALWATFNEPTCYTFLAFIAGMMPPGHMVNLVEAGRTMMNIFIAHTATYKALKALPGGDKASIGLVHHHITFRAAGSGVLHWVAERMAEWMEYWWGWDVTDRWMVTGMFEWRLPVMGTWIARDLGKPPCDWWGINYYSRPVLSWWLQPVCFPSEIMTDMYYPIYPEGMYKAITRSSRYGIPMYITETGIADSRDDRRAIMIDSYMKEVLRAVADGYDVRGFYYWTLVDNFEWATGFTMKFGLYQWEPDGSVDRRLKEGSRVLIQYFDAIPSSLQELKVAARKLQEKLGPDMGVEEELEREGFVLVKDDTKAGSGPQRAGRARRASGSGGLRQRRGSGSAAEVGDGDGSTGDKEGRGPGARPQVGVVALG